MKRSMRTMFVLLAVVMSLVALQAVWAGEFTVTGTIERIGTTSIDVKAEDPLFYTLSTIYHLLI